MYLTGLAEALSEGKFTEYFLEHDVNSSVRFLEM